MIDPVQAFSKTRILPVPTSDPSVGPIPSPIPLHPYVEEIGKAGKITLWIVFLIMLLSSLSFTIMGMRVRVEKRLFHVLTTFVTLFAAISYFAMATGDGYSFTAIIVKETHKKVVYDEIHRQVFWARYIDWSLTTPLLLLDLAFLAGLNGANIIIAIVADIVMILTGVFGAFGHSGIQKWGYYAMGCIAYVVVVWIFSIEGRHTAAAKNNATAHFFTALGGFTLLLWTLYPVVWGIGDGGRLLSVDAEITAYAILDVLAKPVFGFWLLITHARSDASSIEGFWSRGLSTEGSLRLEDDEGA